MDMMFVEDCCQILDSMRVPITASNREEGEYPYYGANGIQDYVADYIFDDELVLLAEDGGNFGSKERPIAYRVSGKCWVNNHAHVLKPKEGLDVDYLCYSLMFYKVDGMVNGATRQKLTQAAMRKMQIPSRSIDEQKYIVDELNRIINFAKVIDNYMTYAQSAIDEFADSKKMPQIAISVDMLDTGIDVPEVVNLVFFKKVMSKAKFWQMIGRGTRLCPGLIDGEDKQKFYIFDFCGNFEFFRMNKGKASANMIALQGAIFNLKFEISYKLQDIAFQNERLIAYRNALVQQMSEKVKELPRDNFAVRQHLKYIDLYSIEANYQTLTYEDTLVVREEVAPLILPDGDEVNAIRFDALMYGIELAYLVGKKYTKARSDLYKKVAGIASVANIPEIQVQADFINKILNTDYVEQAGIAEFEEIRERLRNLIKYIPKNIVRYDTNFEDDLLSIEWKDSELENDELKNYKAKAEYYIRQHQDNIAIAKLKTNQPLTATDIETLEEILWREVGTKQDYENEFGTKPLGEFVREIVGLDMNAAKEAFSEYLTNTSLDSRQIYFVNQIVEYIVHNGMLKDFSVLQESPFTDQGSVVEIFTDISVWLGIKKVIDTINANAVA